ncbi:MAG: hypothetical protein JXR84_15215 [Anaerolineae bacterium]|nr:hypothetical protein [Anaerolineae bacterium]
MAEHNVIGAFGEYAVEVILRKAGVDVKRGKPADLICNGVPVEVKTARPTRYDGRKDGFQFSLRRDGHTNVRAPLVICVCVFDPEDLFDSELDFFIIPSQDIEGLRGVAIHKDTAAYNGRWARYRQNWSVLEEVLYAAAR